MKKKVLLLLTISCVSCDEFSTESEIKELVLSDSSALENTCNRFLAANSINSISIYNSYDSTLCESINGWSHCGNGWETWDKKREKQLSLSSKADVLKFEDISLEEYKYYERFLKERDLTNIGRVYNCSNCVDLESGRVGLRYSTNQQYILKKDYEYLYVEKISSHWFIYHRDWN